MQNKAVNEYKIAGCVILYFPNNEVIENIESYITKLDQLYVVNNGGGEIVFETLSKRYKNLALINYDENNGIAKPLNDVLSLAKDRYDFLLTMDQDSKFSDTIDYYLESLCQFDWKSTLGLGPHLRLNNVTDTCKEKNLKWKKVFSVITSGNIINISNAVRIGCFLEDLFIDEVDNEFCYRGYIKGYYTYQSTGDIYIDHNLGNQKKIRLIRDFHPTMHNYIRTYYIFRNKTYVIRNYHDISFLLMWREYYWRMFKLLVSKTFFENDKKRKLHSVFRGIYHGLTNNMGKKDF
ncbi:MAG: hypothetical protein SOV56_00565 [Phascolarctobacterium sp.]|nr:hypothetical protein [Phascolarctobacterium sp.]